MMKRAKRVLICLVMMCGAPFLSFGWAAEGHRICGEIAWRYLTPRARAAVELVLNGETLPMAGNWADEIKKDRSLRYLKKWHYIDFESDMSYPQLQAWLARDNHIDAYTRICFLAYMLKQNRLNSRQRKISLLLLIHLVEDIHQPMHTAHADDNGGNRFKVMWQNKQTSLHGLWDYNLIAMRHLGYRKYAAAIDETTAQQRLQWQQEPLSRWIYESNQLAQGIYKNVTPGAVLGGPYYSQNITIVNQQLLKAGVRLAGLLNRLFG